MLSFKEDLARAVAYHGHLCSGQMTGVRMARLACQILKIDDPATSKRLIVFVESDRCIADAIGIVTGCKIGKRTLKWMDFGKTAATFIDTKTSKAVRIHSIFHEFPKEGESVEDFYSKYTDEELFAVEEVEVSLKEGDLPGPPSQVQVCSMCGEEVLDGKHVVKDGKILCKHCAGMGYYKVL